ncbi:MAG: T9SS type A sorting domain-containing protein [Bacteroidetes bacterium]|nr:T9SS type A sorting domain-containing protein [Bacteroidota bacterium]
MKQLLLLIPFLLGSSLFAQEPHHRLRLDLEQHSLKEIARLGLGLDHGQHVPGEYLVSDFPASALPKLRAAGVPYQIVIPDVGDWYGRQNEQAAFRSDGCNTEDYPYPRPANYRDGSMGGYFTYAEMLSELEQMAEMYPELITAPATIGDFTSERGNPVYWLRVSDQAQADEAEPEVLYTALHHAREPNSLSQMIFFLWYLLENYGTDPEVTYLLDETELYFIPCINPDGYIFNEENNPNGGGMWRKNLAEISGVPFGVDLNRNYGYEWGFDDFGSSSEPNSPVYRGPEPFSEPETQAVKYLCEQHEFQIVLNYHTHGNLLIHPWGYNDQPTGEDPIFKGLASVMTAQNSFRVGTATETVGYIVNGPSDDWMYGEMESKPKAYAYTPEVGNSFWPAASQIENLNKSCVWQNLAAAHLLHHYVQIADYPRERLTQQQGSLELQLQRFGLGAGSVTVEAEAVSPHVALTANAQSYQLDLLEQAAYSFNYQISPGEELVVPIRVAVHIDNGTYVKTDTLAWEYLNGQLTSLSADSAFTDEAWQNISGWGLTSEYFTSAPTSWTDSPNGEYSANAASVIISVEPVTLTGAEQYLLQYNARWALEEDFDFVQIQVSTNGANWQPLCGRYTEMGNGTTLPASPLYTGIQEDWVREEIDLSEYAGESVYFQFWLQADQFVELDGFYFDDFNVLGLTALPTAEESVAVPGQQLRVYPNPTTDWLFAETPAQAAAAVQELQLLNSLGQVVARQRDRAPAGIKWQQPTASLPNGVYFLRYLVDGQVQAVERVVK